MAETLVNFAKRPFIVVTILYVTGVVLAFLFPLPLAWLFPISFAVGVLALCGGRFRPWLLAALLILVGWTNLVTRTAIISPQDLRVVVGDSFRYVTLRGTLVATPVETLVSYDKEEPLRTHAIIEVQSIEENSVVQPVFGQVTVTTKGRVDEEFFGGQTVALTGVLRHPPIAAAEGLFDYRAYLAWQGISYQLFATPDDWDLWSDGTPPREPLVSDRFNAWAQDVMALDLPTQDKELELLWAMTLGWKTALTDEVSEPFMQSGTMHIFAISGLHIALIAGILVALLRVAQVPRSACGLVVIPLIWFYTGATGWQSSAIRSTIMMTVIIVGWSLKRPSNLLNSLAASGFIILLWQPQQLFQASFQLSFFVVLSIALLMPTFDAVRKKLLASDPLLPDELRPRWRKWLDAALLFLAANFATSLAAWFGSLPLIAYYFHLFTPGSLLANLIVVPLSSFALACNLGSLICGDWLPWLTALFNHAGWFFMAGMVKVSNWSITLPGAVYYVPGPTLFDCLAYYALAFGVLTKQFFQPRWRRPALVFTLALSAFWIWRWQDAQHETRLTFLSSEPVAYVDQPGNSQDALLDAGSATGIDFRVKDFLHTQGVNQLPHLLLTHGDKKHVGGAQKLDTLFHIREIATSAATGRSPAYREILKMLERTPERWRKLQRGDHWNGFEVLHPDASDRFTQADDQAVVLRGEFNGVRILLLSDLGKAGQRVLLEREKNLRADIVVVGTPAKGEPLNDAMLDAVQPALVLLQADPLPAHQHDRKLFLDHLHRRDITAFNTADDGSLTLILRDGKWKLRSMQGAEISGKAGEGNIAPRQTEPQRME